MACLCDPVITKIQIGDIINEHRPLQPCVPIGCIIDDLIGIYLEGRADLLTGVTVMNSTEAYEIPEDHYWITRLKDLMVEGDIPDIVLYMGEGSDFGVRLEEWICAYRMQVVMSEDEYSEEEIVEEDEGMPALEGVVIGLRPLGALIAAGALVRAVRGEYEELVNLENVSTPLENKSLLKKIAKTEENCAICLDPPEGECYKTPCSHYYCIKCLDTWLETSKLCPICRHELDMIKNVS